MNITKHSKAFVALVFNWLVQGSIAVLCFTILHYAYLFFLPTSFVFQYTSIEPVKDSFGHSEIIQMRTHADWYRGAEVSWVDTLRCPPIAFVSQSHSLWFKNKWDKARGVWQYGEITPILDSKCFMESTIVATIEYGIKKKVTKRSGYFTIK